MHATLMALIGRDMQASARDLSTPMVFSFAKARSYDTSRVGQMLERVNWIRDLLVESMSD